MMAFGCHTYTWAPAETDGISIRTETKSNGRFWPRADYLIEKSELEGLIGSWYVWEPLLVGA
ncbi:hypothetical protein SAMN05444506_1225 [Pseudomonas syringae]|nr:hypothetical protein SAMN05444506_1225 [Pseudomonas syringae]